MKRNKRLEKQGKSLMVQSRKHKDKADTVEGSKDTTKDYWLKEAERYEKQAKERMKKLEKLKR